MVDEHSDILGGHLQKVPSQSYKAWMAENPSTTAALAVVFSLLSYFVIIPAFNRWQDRRYRKALRRRYGIPDDDERPFAIAYAAARSRTHGESDEGSREVSEQPEQGAPHPRRGRSDVPMLVRRQPEGEDISHVREPELPHTASHVPYVSQYDPRQVVYNAWQTGPSSTPVGDPVIREYARTPAQRISDSLVPILPGSVSDTPHQSIPPPALKTHGKHARDDDETGQPEKKTRLVGAAQEVDEGVVVDGEDVTEDMDVDVQVVQPKRGAKRQANAEDDEGIEQVRSSGRDKRARKTSREQVRGSSDKELAEVEAESEDEVTELQPLQRGKKRDRDEAGSTFGGDESVADEGESDDDHKSRRRRKRRAVAGKVLDAGRGQKRPRDDASEESEEEPDRYKRRDIRRHGGNRDIELLDAPLSNDPLCKGRRIGEEWEVNGIHHKVGPNGQRLRQELVKRSRTRFPMPKDSDHPDRRTNIDVYVETWLTDEEYQAAKEHGDLAWQDSPTSSVPGTPGDVSDFPSGKSLLWSSTSSTLESPAPKRGPFSQSIVTNVGLHLDPFHQSQAPPRRRVSSVPQVPIIATTPEPSPSKPRTTTKTYSKWEKQDLEAAAMAKLREKRLAEAREAMKVASVLPPQTATQPGAISSAASSAIPAPAAPLLTFTKPTEKEAENQAQSIGNKVSTPLSFGMPPAPAASTHSTSNDTPASTASIAPAQEAQKNFFNIAPTSASATPASTSTTQQASSIPNFFSKTKSSNATPGSQPSTQPQPAPTASAFNFGAKPASATPGSVPSSNPFGTSAQASVAPATSSSSAPKSAFSFAPPASNTPVEKKPEQATSTGAGAAPSLLSRLGPQVQGSSTTQQQTSAPAASSPLKFSFTQPSAPTLATATSGSAQRPAFAPPSTPASDSTTSVAQMSTTPAGALAATSSNTSTGTTFSFGLPGVKQFSNPSAAAPASSTSAASGTANQATPLPFSFGAKPSAPASQSSGDALKAFGAFGSSGQTVPSTSASSTTTTPSAFGFGAPTSSNIAAGPSPFGAPTSNATTTPNKSAGANPFSTTPAGTPASSSIFSGSAGDSTNQAAPKPAFSFGVTGGTPAFGSAGASSALSSAANPFGTAAGSTTPSMANSAEAQSRPPSFNFGAAPSSSAMAPSGVLEAKPSATPTFGATSQPASNAFNFGNASSSTPSAFTFGPSSNTNQNQKQ